MDNKDILILKRAYKKLSDLSKIAFNLKQFDAARALDEESIAVLRAIDYIKDKMSL